MELDFNSGPIPVTLHCMTTTATPPSTGSSSPRAAPATTQARTVWNAMVDRRPRLIVRCASVDDVVRARSQLARERDLEIGVRCGGHSVAGLAVPDDGLMIDLTPMDAVRVDPAAPGPGRGRRAARRPGPRGAAARPGDDGGQRLAHRRRRADPRRRHGMARPPVRPGLRQRRCPSGGHRRRRGACGRAATEHPELFWGLRGGGGNFGIVTEFEFRAAPGRHAGAGRRVRASRAERAGAACAAGAT